MIYSQKYQFEFGYSHSFDSQMEDLLLTKYQILDYDVEDITAQTQLSKAEIRQNYVYVAIQLPEYDKASQKFVVKDLHCFISSRFFLVIDRNESKHFKQFITFQERILSEEESIDPFIIFYELLDYVVTKAYKAIFKFRSDIADLESDLFKFENDLDVVKDILIIKKDLINFESYIEPLQDTILDLEIKSAKFHPEAKDRLDSTLDIVKKILNNLRNFKEQMNLLSETFFEAFYRSFAFGGYSKYLDKFFWDECLFWISRKLFASYLHHFANSHYYYLHYKISKEKTMALN
jgi:Mg2+ and Co2+ transporter CorA